jgi:hypothetical protein
MIEIKTVEYEFTPEEIAKILENHMFDVIKEEFSSRKVRSELIFNLVPADYDGPGCPTYVVRSAKIRVGAL